MAETYSAERAERARRVTEQPRLQAYILSNSIPEPNSGCWLWERGFGKDGYGQAYLNPRRRSIGAHRVAFLAFRGDPGPLLVLHRCDNRPCVNPDHLFLGTQADNMSDKTQKGRQARGARHGQAKLTDSIVRNIRSLVAGGRTQRSVARQMQVSETTVSRIMKGRDWNHVR